MIIGFGNGNFHRLYSDDKERFSHEQISLFQANNQANAIELHCLNEEHINCLLHIKNIDLSYFKYISLHAPDLQYQKDETSNKILSKLLEVYKKYKIQNIVFHVDKVKNWDVFLDFSTLPISIENMDNHKEFGRSINDIRSILEKYNFNLTLDLQHCFVNDKSLKLASDFQELYKKKIVEYHISGYEETYLHYPLFKTFQNQIIDSLKYKNVPIIIESTFDEIGEQEKELEYIKQRLN